MTNYEYLKTLPMDKMATWFMILNKLDLSNAIATYKGWRQFLQEDFSPELWELLWKVYENPSTIFD